MSNGNDKVKIVLTSMSELFAQELHEISESVRTSQQLAATGGIKGPGVGPHLEDLIKQTRKVQALSGELSGLALQLKAAFGYLS